MVKKIICIIFLITYSINCFAVESVEEGALDLECPYAILMEQSTNRVLYAKNERKKVKIASTTKILTAIVAIENCDLEEKVTISKKAAYMGGSTVGLKAGSEVTLNSLMYGMLLKSGNDCATAIAEHVGGSVENFVKMMNEKAYEIGAKDTVCSNAHGLDTDENHSTAYDLALITCYAKQNETISKMLGTKSITVPFGSSSKYLANTNRLLFSNPYCDGGKTGFTNIANRCLVLTGKKGDLKVVAVVLGAETTDARFRAGNELLNYGIDNYKMVDVGTKVHWYIDVPVYKGKELSYVQKVSIPYSLPLKEGEVEELYISQSVLPSINAPVKRGTYLGKIELYIKDEKLYEKNIYTDYAIEKNTVLDYMKRGFKSIFFEEYLI